MCIPVVKVLSSNGRKTAFTRWHSTLQPITSFTLMNANYIDIKCRMSSGFIVFLLTLMMYNCRGYPIIENSVIRRISLTFLHACPLCFRVKIVHCDAFQIIIIPVFLYFDIGSASSNVFVTTTLWISLLSINCFNTTLQVLHWF